MKGYILKYNNDIVCITNNPKRWLKENNKQRKKDGHELESLHTFQITLTDLELYN